MYVASNKYLMKQAFFIPNENTPSSEHLSFCFTWRLTGSNNYL